jgi:hypothetical protein
MSAKGGEGMFTSIEFGDGKEQELNKVYEKALDEILALDPGLWKTMQRIAAKALGVEYVEDG